MRLGVAVAIACLSVTGISMAGQARAAVRKSTSIAAQGLAPALQSLAKERDIQIVYRTDLVRDRRTGGAAGELTIEEALTKLLSGTGLTFRYLQDNGITVVPLSTESLQSNSTSSQVEEKAAAAESAVTSEAGATSTEPTEGSTKGSNLEEITVTAQRREERLQDVPMSITALSADVLATMGAKNIADVSRFTPGLTLVPAWAGSTNISIRGISSFNGAATTAIYIDDAPIQVRFLGAGVTSTNPYPVIFDLDRVEVLKGPQGTPFGGGSEGGAVRFITPAPSFDGFSGHARTEVGFTEGGEPSYEIGAAAGGALVDDKIAFRLSAYNRNDGGWIDRRPFPGGTAADDDANSTETNVVHAALSFKPMDALTITPSVFYQSIERRDADLYWQSLSNTGKGEFVSGSSLAEPWQDRFALYAVKASFDFDRASLISNTSYLDRKQSVRADYSNYLAELLGLPYDAAVQLGVYSPTPMENGQKSFTQEVRLQSRADASKLIWTVGLFYQSADQTAAEKVLTADLDVLLPGLANLPGDVSYVGNDESRDRQAAAFGQLDYRLTDEWTVTVGGRFTKMNFEYTNRQDGPINGGPSGSAGKSSDEAFTPRYGVQYKPTDDVLVYANAAKGFRPGGANNPIPATRCAADLSALGLQQAPSDYDTDSVWSYEVGSKATLFSRKVQIEAAAFQIDWSGIQNRIYLGSCGFGYVANLGTAESRGFEARITALPLSGLTLSASAAYTDATMTETVLGPPRADGTRGIISGDGDRMIGAPWSVDLSADYRFNVPGLSPEAYVHLDYSNRSAYNFGTQPGGVGYDPYSNYRAETNFVSARVGIETASLDLSVFVQNLLDSDDQLFSLPSTHGPNEAPELVRASTFRPRTIGLTATYRF